MSIHGFTVHSSAWVRGHHWHCGNAVSGATWPAVSDTARAPANRRPSCPPHQRTPSSTRVLLTGPVQAPTRTPPCSVCRAAAESLTGRRAAAASELLPTRAFAQRVPNLASSLRASISDLSSLDPWSPTSGRRPTRAAGHSWRRSDDRTFELASEL